MKKVTLGSTGIVIEKNGFGCLPIQRISQNEAVYLLHKALDNGMNYFDTARSYSNSEEKVGAAFSDRREKLFIATKTAAVNADEMWQDLHTSLKTLKTDYIDIYQFHNPDFCPKPEQENGLYEAALKAKEQGKIRHISITNHSLAIANEVVESGLYETLQFPFCYLATEPDYALVEKTLKAGMGFIAMKGLSGGLIRNGLAAAAFMQTQENVVPIWGVQREWELDQFLTSVKGELVMTEELKAIIEQDRKDLVGDFCRGCGYCMPCPVGIQINDCARMAMMIRRAPDQNLLTPVWQEKMMKIENCLHCRKCASKCPYHLDTPKLLAEHLEDYKKVLAAGSPKGIRFKNLVY